MNKHKKSSSFTNNKGIYLLMGWMVVTPWISTILITHLALEHEAFIHGFQNWQWALFYILSAFTMGLAITPTTFIALISGFFLGFEGLLFIVISYQFASMIGYYLANFVNNNFIELIIDKYPKAADITKNVSRNQWMTTIMARISPALPFGLMNVVLSVSNIKPKPFFIGGLVGMLPRTVFFVWLGTQANVLIQALQSGDHIAIAIAVTLVALYIMYKILKPKSD